jgi:hypothetical protein
MRAASHSQCGSSNKLIRTSRALWIPPVAASHPGIIYEKLRPSPTGAISLRRGRPRISRPRLLAATANFEVPTAAPGRKVARQLSGFSWNAALAD